MDLKQIVENIYVNKKSDWIQKLEDNEIQPFTIQLWLVRNDFVRNQVRWLDKYIFCLPPKMFLSLVWSIIPKSQTPPRITDWVKVDEKKDIFLSGNVEFDFILKKIKKQFKLSDNDFKCLKPRLIEAIKKDMVAWFYYYGVEKRYWKRYRLNFEKMKCDTKVKVKQGLSKWGM